MGLDRLLRLLGGVEDNIAGGIVDPLDPEMGVDVEVVPNELVAHVVHPEEQPAIRPDLDLFLGEIGGFSFVEELYSSSGGTITGLHLEFGVKLLHPRLDLHLPFLEVLDLLEEDALQVLDVPRLARLLDLEELELGQGHGGEGGAEFLRARLELVVELGELLLLAG